MVLFHKSVLDCPEDPVKQSLSLLGCSPLEQQTGPVGRVHSQVNEDPTGRKTHLCAFGVQQRHDEPVH